MINCSNARTDTLTILLFIVTRFKAAMSCSSIRKEKITESSNWNCETLFAASHTACSQVARIFAVELLPWWLKGSFSQVHRNDDIINFSYTVYSIHVKSSMQHEKYIYEILLQQRRLMLHTIRNGYGGSETSVKIVKNEELWSINHTNYVEAEETKEVDVCDGRRRIDHARMLIRSQHSALEMWDEFN